MKDKKILLLATLLIFLVVLSVFAGCDSHRNPPETFGTLSMNNPNELRKANIKKFIVVKDLSHCVKSFNKDWDYDTQVISAFENTVVYAMGSGKVVHPPTGLVYEDRLVIYDANRNRVVKIIDADPGFVQFWDTGINKKWIVYDEVDKEFGQKVKCYAINRETGKTKLIFSVSKEDRESGFWFGETVKSKLENLEFNLSETILSGDKIYVGYNLVAKNLPSASNSRIVSIDLNSLSKSLLINVRNPNAGLSHFSVNENFVTFSIFGRNKDKMFSDVYVYSLKTKTLKRFTDNNLSCAPSLTPDNYVVFVLRSKESMKIPPKGYNDNEYLVIAPVCNPCSAKIITKSSKSDQIRISPDGRFVLLDSYEEGWFVYDRKKHYLLLLKGDLLPVRPCFASNNLIVGLHQKDGGFSILNMALLYKILNLDN